MPIFEYVCRSCGRQFEALVMSGAEPECPGCSGRDLDKQMSAFAVGGGAETAPPPGPCGRMCDKPGGCAFDD